MEYIHISIDRYSYTKPFIDVELYTWKNLLEMANIYCWEPAGTKVGVDYSKISFSDTDDTYLREGISADNDYTATSQCVEYERFLKKDAAKFCEALERCISNNSPDSWQDEQSVRRHYWDLQDDPYQYETLFMSVLRAYATPIGQEVICLVTSFIRENEQCDLYIEFFTDDKSYYHEDGRDYYWRPPQDLITLSGTEIIKWNYLNDLDFPPYTEEEWYGYPDDPYAYDDMVFEDTVDEYRQIKHEPYVSGTDQFGAVISFDPIYQ